MNKSILNITNGDAFNRYFLSRFGGEAIPFREAMMEGKAVSDIFSDEFIVLRSAELSVSEDEYRAGMLVKDTLQNGNFGELHLWFGKDTFCQMNLLTLLAYLEQIGYDGNIILNYIDDESFEVVESDISVELGIYKRIYREALIMKEKPTGIGVLNPRAIELYFDYVSEDGLLDKAVRENYDRDDTEIVLILLEKSKEYGLSDVQARKLIKRNKNNL